MTDFVIPVKRKPRDRYHAVTLKANSENSWPGSRVQIMDENDEVVYEYHRNYGFLDTFEPFRQLRDGVWRDYALISSRYTQAEVVDLEAGQVIANEVPSERLLTNAREFLERYKDQYPDTTPEEVVLNWWGFCPVEFYVPDWWDVHDGSIKPGTEYWSETYEHPTGEFAVYSGCVWGDDTSWKVRYIDLSHIADEGVIRCDNRFGYVELGEKTKLRDAARYSAYSDHIHIAIDIAFDRDTGKAAGWSVEGINVEEKSDA